MPKIKSAKKWVRRSAKRRVENLDVKTRLKTLYKTAVASNDAATIRGVESAYDKAAKRGIIHPNKAARKRSRLARAAARNLTPATVPEKKRKPAAPRARKTAAPKTTTRKKAAK